MSARSEDDRFVGIDAGGSRTTAVMVDTNGVEIARHHTGSSGFQDYGPEVAADSIQALLADLPDHAGGRPLRRLVCAMAGGSLGGPAKELRGRLVAARLAEEVAVIADADAAFHAAFGDEAGIVVIAGTGSIAFGIAVDGSRARSGGTRPPGGDPGSGEWLARQAIHALGVAGEPGPNDESTLLRNSVLAHTGVSDAARLGKWAREASRTEVAAMAEAVAAAARAGDPTAVDLLQRAAEQLADQAFAVEARLAPWTSPPAIGLAGGLLDPQRPLRDLTTAVLAARSPSLATLAGRVDGALGAARLALRGGFAST